MDYRPFIAGGVLVIAVVLAFVLPQESAPVVTGTGEGSPVASGTMLSAAVVEAHSTPEDCWTIVEGKVYDVTPYVPYHPGGRAEISEVCGRDGTALFTTSAGRKHSQNAHSILANYYVGDFGSMASSTQPSPTTPAVSYEDAIKEQYPGAQLEQENYEDDGSVEGTFRWRGQTYEFETDGVGNLIEVES